MCVLYVSQKMSASTGENYTAVEAFIHYRKRWFGAVAFPPVVFIASEFYEVPGFVFAILFFAAIIPAMTPCFQGKVPFGYWMLVLAAWMGSASISMSILAFIRMVLGEPINK